MIHSRTQLVNFLNIYGLNHYFQPLFFKFLKYVLSIYYYYYYYYYYYSKTCLKRNAIVPVFFSVFIGFRFTKGCVLIKQSTKNMIA